MNSEAGTAAAAPTPDLKFSGRGTSTGIAATAAWQGCRLGPLRDPESRRQRRGAPRGGGLL